MVALSKRQGNNGKLRNAFSFWNKNKEEYSRFTIHSTLIFKKEDVGNYRLVNLTLISGMVMEENNQGNPFSNILITSRLLGDVSMCLQRDAFLPHAFCVSVRL